MKSSTAATLTENIELIFSGCDALRHSRVNPYCMVGSSLGLTNRRSSKTAMLGTLSYHETDSVIRLTQATPRLVR